MSIISAAALPHKQRTRRLIVVDIENLVGGPVVNDNDTHRAKAALLTAVGNRADDQVVIASDAGALRHIGFTWCGPRYLVGHGPNGADLALVEVLCTEHIAERFDEVVIASGDGIFTDEAARLATHGVTVTVVGQQGHVARRLRLAASRVIYIQTHPASDHGSAA